MKVIRYFLYFDKFWKGGAKGGASVMSKIASYWKNLQKRLFLNFCCLAKLNWCMPPLCPPFSKKESDFSLWVPFSSKIKLIVLLKHFICEFKYQSNLPKNDWLFQTKNTFSTVSTIFLKQWNLLVFKTLYILIQWSNKFDSCFWREMKL